MRQLRIDSKMRTRPADHWKFIDIKSCSMRLRGTDQEEIHSEVIANFKSAEVFGDEVGEAALESLLERERLASTGIGRGVAIAHVKVKGLEEACASVSIHREGLEWRSLDREPINLFFTILRPERATDSYDPEKHIEMMRWITRLGQDEDFRCFSLRLKNKKELRSLLKEKAGV
jgi:mannitol/fructose-specific phosphotransferase system IIA component (Ntr-type)